MEDFKMEAPPAPTQETRMAEMGKEACLLLAEWHRSSKATADYKAELAKVNSDNTMRVLRIEANLATARADFVEVDDKLRKLASKLYHSADPSRSAKE